MFGYLPQAQIAAAGLEDNIKNNRPMVFVGYGKTSKPLTKTMRVLVGIEGFYMGESKDKHGNVNIVQSDVINEKEVVTKVMGGGNDGDQDNDQRQTR